MKLHEWCRREGKLSYPSGGGVTVFARPESPGLDALEDFEVAEVIPPESPVFLPEVRMVKREKVCHRCGEEDPCLCPYARACVGRPT